MCKLSLQLLLHINSRFAGLNGYTDAVAGSTSGQGEASSSSPSQKNVKQREMGSAGSALVQEILYATSGCLHNIARHPHNVYIMYNIELKVKIRRAAADLLNPRGSSHRTPTGSAIATSSPIDPSSQSPIAVCVQAATDSESHEDQPALKGDHVRDMAHVNIPNIDLTAAQQDVSYAV